MHLNCQLRIALFIVIYFLSFSSLSFGSDLPVYDRYLDLNLDGVMDVKYEYRGGVEFELTDSNYDGVFDLIAQLDNDGNFIHMSYDQDFNGFIESRDYYKYGSIYKTVVDLNEDSKIDFVFLYENSQHACSSRYYGGDNPYIESIDYEFGLPSFKDKIEILSAINIDIEDVLSLNCRNRLKEIKR